MADSLWTRQGMAGKYGGYCDCEVLANVEPYWSENEQ
jgi:hypothetical protein